MVSLRVARYCSVNETGAILPARTATRRVCRAEAAGARIDVHRIFPLKCRAIASVVLLKTYLDHRSFPHHSDDAVAKLRLKSNAPVTPVDDVEMRSRPAGQRVRSGNGPECTIPIYKYRTINEIDQRHRFTNWNGLRESTRFRFADIEPIECSRTSLNAVEMVVPVM